RAADCPYAHVYSLGLVGLCRFALRFLLRHVRAVPLSAGSHPLLGRCAPCRDYGRISRLDQEQWLAPLAVNCPLGCLPVVVEPSGQAVPFLETFPPCFDCGGLWGYRRSLVYTQSGNGWRPRAAYRLDLESRAHAIQFISLPHRPTLWFDWHRANCRAYFD